MEHSLSQLLLRSWTFVWKHPRHFPRTVTWRFRSQKSLGAMITLIFPAMLRLGFLTWRMDWMFYVGFPRILPWSHGSGLRPFWVEGVPQNPILTVTKTKTIKMVVVTHWIPSPGMIPSRIRTSGVARCFSNKRNLKKKHRVFAPKKEIHYD